MILRAAFLLPCAWDRSREVRNLCCVAHSVWESVVHAVHCNDHGAVGLLVLVSRCLADVDDNPLHYCKPLALGIYK